MICKDAIETLKWSYSGVLKAVVLSLAYFFDVDRFSFFVAPTIFVAVNLFHRALAQNFALFATVFFLLLIFAFEALRRQLNALTSV